MFEKTVTFPVWLDLIRSVFYVRRVGKRTTLVQIIVHLLVKMQALRLFIT